MFILHIPANPVPPMTPTLRAIVIILYIPAKSCATLDQALHHWDQALGQRHQHCINYHNIAHPCEVLCQPCPSLGSLRPSLGASSHSTTYNNPPGIAPPKKHIFQRQNTLWAQPKFQNFFVPPWIPKRRFSQSAKKSQNKYIIPEKSHSQSSRNSRSYHFLPRSAGAQDYRNSKSSYFLPRRTGSQISRNSQSSHFLPRRTGAQISRNSKSSHFPPRSFLLDWRKCLFCTGLGIRGKVLRIPEVLIFFPVELEHRVLGIPKVLIFFPVELEPRVLGISEVPIFCPIVLEPGVLGIPEVLIFFPVVREAVSL